MSAGALGSPVVDFSSLDFSSVQEDLVKFAQSTFPTELWTDFNDSNFGTHLIELMAFASDLLTYTSNAQSLETVVATLVREQNFRNIARTYGYTLKSASPSRSTERCTLDPIGSYPFTISSHLQFTSGDGLVFQPDGDTAVASYPGLGYVDIAITQGDEQYQEAVGTTSGQAGQVLFLARADLIDGTLDVSVGGVGYSQVTNFIEASSTDKVYTLSTSEQGITAIIFGNGFTGVIPPVNQAIVATYKTGGGLSTNLPAGTIINVAGTSDGSAVPLQILSASNITSATDGGPKQSLASAKLNLPQAIKANDRAVTLGDFAALSVKLVSGVLKANAVAGRFYGGSAPVLVFVVPNGGGNPTDALKNVVVTALKDKKLAGKRIRVLDPVYVSLDINVDLFVKANSPTLLTSNRVRSAILAKYALEAVDFASVFALQDAYDSVDPTVIPGVNRVFFNKFTVKPLYARHVNQPSTGTGTVENLYVVQDTVRRREWFVKVLPPSGLVLVNRFQVVERRLGVATAISDTLLQDETASYLPNELPGVWTLRPRPEDPGASFVITGNTTQSITVTSGLLVEASPDDPYALERTDPTIGKILRTMTAAAVAASTSVPVVSSTSFEIGDRVRFSDAEEGDYRTVAGVSPGLLTLAAPVTTAVGSFVTHLWVAQDNSVQFSVLDGATPFVAGDEVYVDTFAKAGDILLRGENYPIIADANLVINASGGSR